MAYVSRYLPRKRTLLSGKDSGLLVLYATQIACGMRYLTKVLGCIVSRCFDLILQQSSFGLICAAMPGFELDEDGPSRPSHEEHSGL